MLSPKPNPERGDNITAISSPLPRHQAVSIPPPWQVKTAAADDAVLFYAEKDWLKLPPQINVASYRHTEEKKKQILYSSFSCSIQTPHSMDPSRSVFAFDSGFLSFWIRPQAEESRGRILPPVSTSVQGFKLALLFILLSRSDVSAHTHACLDLVGSTTPRRPSAQHCWNRPKQTRPAGESVCERKTRFCTSFSSAFKGLFIQTWLRGSRSRFWSEILQRLSDTVLVIAALRWSSPPSSSIRNVNMQMFFICAFNTQMCERWVRNCSVWLLTC